MGGEGFGMDQEAEEQVKKSWRVRDGVQVYLVAGGRTVSCTMVTGLGEDAIVENRLQIAKVEWGILELSLGGFILGSLVGVLQARTQFTWDHFHEPVNVSTAPSTRNCHRVHLKISITFIRRHGLVRSLTSFLVWGPLGQGSHHLCREGQHHACPLLDQLWRLRGRFPYLFQITVRLLLVRARCCREELIQLPLFRSLRRSAVASKRFDVSRGVTYMFAEGRESEALRRVSSATPTRSDSTGVIGAWTSLESTLRGIEVFRIVYWNFLDGDCFVIAKHTCNAMQMSGSCISFSSTRKPT